MPRTNTFLKNLPNIITGVRLGMIFVAMALAISQGPAARAWAAVLVILAIALDSADGWVARRFGGASSGGAIFDILADRLAECCCWITLAVVGAVPLWVPLIVVSRGFITDSLRGLAYAQGQSAFGENSMLSSPLAKALVGSRESRAIYGVTKLVALAWLFGLHALVAAPGALVALIPLAQQVAMVLVSMSVAMCVLRGMPVLLESRRSLSSTVA